MEFLQSVGILDIIFITILSISVLIGLIRGAVREILSLVGLVASIYLAFKYADMVSKEYISQFFEQQPRISYIIAFVIIIVASIFAIALVNLLISQLLKASGLSFIDRFLGLIFGALRGSLFSAILVMIIGFIPGATQEKWWQESKFAPFFQKIANHSADYIPSEVMNYFNKDADKKGESTSSTTNKSDTMRKEVDNVLQSIDNSLQETAPKLQLETDDKDKNSSKSTINLQSVN